MTTTLAPAIAAFFAAYPAAAPGAFRPPLAEALFVWAHRHRWDAATLARAYLELDRRLAGPGTP